jgi:hypothetical protein
MDFTKIIFEKNSGYDVSDEDLNRIEHKYSFKFPQVLRQYYLSYNGAALKDLYADGIANEGFGLHDIYPVKYKWDYSQGNKVMPVLADVGQMEEFYEWSKDDFPVVVDNDLVPFANEAGGDEYYWQKNTGAVFYLCHEDIDNLIPAFDSVDAFFEAFIRAAEE